jgi:NTP pyrophosphatase (non-canonical NTP hydrolase)
MDLAEFQGRMRTLYGDRDRERGLARTFAWFTEECGELSRALFRGGAEERLHEFGDVLAWLASLADQAGVDLTAAAERYADGCPRCHDTPCACPGGPEPAGAGVTAPELQL